MELSKNRFSRVLAIITTVYICLYGIVVLLSFGTISPTIKGLAQLFQHSFFPTLLRTYLPQLIAYFTRLFTWIIGIVLCVMLLRGKKDKLPGVFFLILGGYMLLIHLPVMMLNPPQSFLWENLFRVLYWLCYSAVFCLIGIGCFTPNKLFSGKQGIWLPIIAVVALLCCLLQYHNFPFYIRNIRLWINAIVLLPYDVLLFALAYCLPGCQKAVATPTDEI